MAAAMSVRCSVVHNFILPKIFETHGKYVSSVRFIKANAASSSLIEEASLVDESQLSTENDTNLESRRNKSRLSPHHRNLLFDEVPFKESKAWYHDTVKYKRRMYGRYGEKSGVNPGIMWPTHEELKEIKEFEAVAFSMTLQEMVQKSEQNKKAAEAAVKARDEDVIKKLAKLNQWKNELNTKIAKKLSDAHAAKERKDRLVEEVRRHFGFKVDPREDRFKEMLEQKEKAEKKSMKEAKKKAKEAKILSKLVDMSVDMNQKDLSQKQE